MKLFSTCVGVVGCGLLGALVACGHGSGEKETPRAAAEPSKETAAGAEMREPDLSTGRVVFDAGVDSRLEVKRTSTGHLLVRPVINGVEKGWFIFDTGAGICVVSTPHVGEFGMTAAGDIQAKGVGGDSSTPLYKAKTLRLGPVTLHDESVMTTDLSFLKQHLGEEIVGVVGYGLFSACIVELSIAEPRISLFDPAKYTLRSGAWEKLELEGRVPAVRASVEGHEGMYRLDTGANRYVTFHQPAVEKWMLLEGREAQGEVGSVKIGGVGGFVAAKRGTLAWFEVGGVRMEKIPAEFAMEAKGTFAEASRDGNIGAEMLRRFTLVLDYQQERIAFLPVAGGT